MHFVLEDKCDKTGILYRQVHYIKSLLSIVFQPALEFWVRESTNVSLWRPLTERPMMPMDMYIDSHTNTDDEDKSTSILQVTYKCIIIRCGGWRVQVANSMFQEVTIMEDPLSSKRWMNSINLIYNQERLEK